MHGLGCGKEANERIPEETRKLSQHVKNTREDLPQNPRIPISVVMRDPKTAHGKKLPGKGARDAHTNHALPLQTPSRKGPPIPRAYLHTSQLTENGFHAGRNEKQTKKVGSPTK